MSGQGGPPEAARVRSGDRRWRCGSFRRALRAEALRRAELPRPVAPVTGRLRYPPYHPGPRPAAMTRPSGTRRSAVAGRTSQRRGGTPRIVRAAPSTRKGTQRSFLTAPQKGGRPEEIANMVLYLCSPEAEFVTGSVLTIDGGWTAG